MDILRIGAGFILLIAGRPAYYVFVGSVGLILGFYLSESVTVTSSEWNELLLPLIFAVFGALAAAAFKRWAARAAGFVAGGYVISNLPVAMNFRGEWDSWILFIITGCFCVTLLFLWFDLTLIFLSCLTGVTFVVQSMDFQSLDVFTMFFLLMTLGLITQFLLMNYSRPSPD